MLRCVFVYRNKDVVVALDITEDPRDLELIYLEMLEKHKDSYGDTCAILLQLDESPCIYAEEVFIEEHDPTWDNAVTPSVK